MNKAAPISNAGSTGQVDGEITPRPGQSWMRGLHRAQGPPRKYGSVGRQQVLQDRVPGQRMAKLKSVPGHQELQRDSAAQALQDNAFGQTGHGRQQVPVEAASEQRPGVQDAATIGAHRVQAVSYTHL